MTALAKVDIDDALCDPHLLGAALGSIEPWSMWRVALKAVFAHPLNRQEKGAFAKIAGNRSRRGNRSARPGA